MHKHVQMGMMKSMQRVYVQHMEVIELLDAGKVRCAHAQAVQNAKFAEQFAHDSSWRVAWQMCGLKDPLSRRRFAGTAHELEVAADWVRAEDEILQRTRSTHRSNQEEEEKKPPKTEEEKKTEKAKREEQRKAGRGRSRGQQANDEF